MICFRAFIRNNSSKPYIPKTKHSIRTIPIPVTERIFPRRMKIDTPEFRSLFTPQLNKLADLFRENNHELRIAGGAVRDLLMNLVPSDVDFASTATPEQMKKLFDNAEIRMLHKRGEEHGTITCRIDDCENFEITTLRVDVVCDGRRAEVQYTTDWQLDANRRDLTINSLFLDLDGEIFDFFGGIDDVNERKVRFVGDAAQRIQEDYLRILRYFRFFGRIADNNAHDADTIKAIIDNAHGLQGISAERIWTELKKIVVGKLAPEVMHCMLNECHLNEYLGIPSDADVVRFEKVYKKFSGNVEPMTMIATLCNNPEHVKDFHSKTKLSNVERLVGEFVISERERAQDARDTGNIDYWRNLIVDMDVQPGHVKPASETVKISGRDRVIQLAMSVCADEKLIEELKEWELPVFPVKGTDLMEAGVPHGPVVRNTLQYLYDLWRDAKFTLSQKELLSHANDPEIPQPVSRKAPGKKRKRQDSQK